MVGANDRLEITQNIKAMEALKAQLLASVSNLYTTLSKNKNDYNERAEILADIVISSYILSSKLDVKAEELDESIINKLKIDILDEDNSLHNDIAMLLRHFNRR